MVQQLIDPLDEFGEPTLPFWQEFGKKELCPPLPITMSRATSSEAEGNGEMFLRHSLNVAPRKSNPQLEIFADMYNAHRDTLTLDRIAGMLRIIAGEQEIPENLDIGYIQHDIVHIWNELIFLHNQLTIAYYGAVQMQLGGVPLEALTADKGENVPPKGCCKRTPGLPEPNNNEKKVKAPLGEVCENTSEQNYMYQGLEEEPWQLRNVQLVSGSPDCQPILKKRLMSASTSAQSISKLLKGMAEYLNKLLNEGKKKKTFLNDLHTMMHSVFLEVSCKANNLEVYIMSQLPAPPNSEPESGRPSASRRMSRSGRAIKTPKYLEENFHLGSSG